MWVDTSAGLSGRPRDLVAERAKISVFVVSYNRSQRLRTCLSALGFADEIVVVDKMSTDDSVAVAERLADRVIQVPWSPTVEETRSYALDQCTHDWILFLDDDECLSPEAVQWIDAELRAPRADIYALPLRHYILGQHDERAYYWPETHPRLFRRGAVSFRSKVHAGTVLHSQRRFEVPAADGVCIHHLSHPDAACWVDKANRYTSRPDRRRMGEGAPDLVAFAHARIDAWMARTQGSDGRDYPAAVAVLRAVYDMVDRVKEWEEAQGIDGDAAFAEIGGGLEWAYAERLGALRRPRGAAAAVPPSATPALAAEDATAFAAARAELDAMRNSTFWRATGPFRRAVEHFRNAGRGGHPRDRQRSVLPPQNGAREDGPAPGRGFAPMPAALPAPLPMPTDIEFRVPPADPVVSVVVPTFGRPDLTLRCLAAMARSLPDATMEVIVVDDASGDPAVAAALAGVRGIRVITHETNLGFLRTCNHAVRRAAGRYVLLLNSDTEVLPGWLDPLVRLLDARPDAGAAGSMLLFPDGKLQEAGGILWRDGTGWTFGRGDDPAKAKYNYVREVDYVSGASLMVRRDLFLRLGGFDEDFAPAYCEDSDLAFRIRAAGLKVLYQPRSRVIHAEGGTHGIDHAGGVKRFNDINQRKLLAKWGAELAAAHFDKGEQVLRAREHGRNRRMVLILSRLAGEATAVQRAMAGDMVKLWAIEQAGAEAARERGIDVLPEGLSGLRDWLASHAAALDEVLVADDDAALFLPGLDLAGTPVRAAAGAEPAWALAPAA